MVLGSLARVAFQGLSERKSRTILTILGIFIGVALITTLVGISQGFTNAINDQLGSLGSETIVVQATGDDLFGPRDIQEIQRMQGSAHVVPAVNGPGTAELAGEDEDITVLGIDPVDLSTVFPGFQMDRGRTLEQAEFTQVVVGEDLDARKDGFLDTGDVVRVTVSKPGAAAGDERAGSYQVVGVADTFDASFLVDVNGAVLMTPRAAQSLFGLSNEYNQMIVVAQDTRSVGPLAESIRTAYEDDEVSVISVQELADNVDTVLGGLSAFIVFIATVSLVVAGLGIANTMLVSVMERTREIGVLRALGFERGEVRNLFILEAGLTGLVGGLLGMLTGVGLSFAIANAIGGFGGGEQPEGAGGPPGSGGDPSPLTITPDLPVELLVGVVLFAVLVAVLAGFLPARKAARMDPVEALRSE